MEFTCYGIRQTMIPLIEKVVNVNTINFDIRLDEYNV